MSLDTFEQSLLTELREYVGSRSPARNSVLTGTRRRWTLGITVGGLTAAAGVAAVIVLGVGVTGPSSAYAVESEPDGDVVVTVFDLSAASGLEQALAAKGVRAEVTYVPGFSQDDGQTRATSGTDQATCAIALSKVGGGLRFTLGAGQIASGGRLDIVTSGSRPTDVGSPVKVAWAGGTC
jgi:hypothetical protein